MAKKCSLIFNLISKSSDMKSFSAILFWHLDQTQWLFSETWGLQDSWVWFPFKGLQIKFNIWT